MQTRVFRIVLFAAAFAASSCFLPANAWAKKHKPKRKTLGEIVFALHPSLRGVAKQSIEDQNSFADRYGPLPRIYNTEELNKLEENGYLIRVPDRSDDFYLDKGLKKRFFRDRKHRKTLDFGDRRYLGQSALIYLDELSAAYAKKFITKRNGGRRPLKVTSLVRTLDYQRWIAFVKHNPNARLGLCDVPEHCSVHFTGHAFDVSTKGMTAAQIFWLADFLAKDIASGLILATYEPNMGDFHIIVAPRNKRRPQNSRGRPFCYNYRDDQQIKAETQSVLARNAIFWRKDRPQETSGGTEEI